MKVIINALRTKSGGSLVYLNSVLPHLAENEDMDMVLVAHEHTLDKIDVPSNVRVEKPEDDSFLQTLWYEQVKLPQLARKVGAKATLNIANFVPFFAPNPVVFVTNNPSVGKYDRKLTEKLRWHGLVWLTRLCLLVCPAVLCNGKYLKKRYAPIWLEWLDHKFRYAPPACTFTEVEEGIKRNPDQILAVGDFYAHKDYPTLLHAFKLVLEKVPDARLMIVGESVDEVVTNQIKATIYDLDLQYAVQIKKGVKRSEMAELYAKSGLYVSTSRAEAFSLTVLEAMTTGTPVLVGDFDFMREIGGSAVQYAPLLNDVTIQRNAGYFAENMLELLQNEEKCKELSEKGLERASKFSWQRTANIILDTLLSLKK